MGLPALCRLHPDSLAPILKNIRYIWDVTKAEGLVKRFVGW